MILERGNKIIVDQWFEEFITNSSLTTLTQAKLDEVAAKVYRYERIECGTPEEQPFLDDSEWYKYLQQQMTFEFISLLSQNIRNIEIGFYFTDKDVKVWYVFSDEEDDDLSIKLMDYEFMAEEMYSRKGLDISSIAYGRGDSMCCPEGFIFLGSNLKH